VLVSEREAALRHGMNDFLSKPIDPDRLAMALARWVRRARRARRMPAADSRRDDQREGQQT